ncbi:MAG: DUF2911 domain-containing protein [Flavobacteriaceae bacterium]|nr:DUF2911 domain-containing protein [Flavobacteriaceae bacterium]
MKSKIIIALTLFVSTLMFGQKSPANSLQGHVNEVKVNIEYSSPRVNERVIFGSLVPYDKVWRAGANENTTIEFDRDVKVNGKKLKKGKYGFFIIPREKNKWICIFSNKNDAVGSSSYNEDEDALRVKVKTLETGSIIENMGFTISDHGIFFAWEESMFELKIK